ARNLLAREIVPDLAPLAKSSDIAVQSATARALGRILANTRDERDGAKSAFDTLEALFDTGNAQTQRAVASALEDFLSIFSELPLNPKDTPKLEDRDIDLIADKIVPLAFRALRKGDLSVRRSIIDTLQRFTELMARRPRAFESDPRRPERDREE